MYWFSFSLWVTDSCLCFGFFTTSARITGCVFVHPPGSENNCTLCSTVTHIYSCDCISVVPSFPLCVVKKIKKHQQIWLTASWPTVIVTNNVLASRRTSTSSWPTVIVTNNVLASKPTSTSSSSLSLIVLHTDDSQAANEHYISTLHSCF